MRGNVVVQHVVYIRRVNNNTLYPCSQADDVAGNVIYLLRNIPDPYNSSPHPSKTAEEKMAYLPARATMQRDHNRKATGLRHENKLN